jgi:hypothetical protein
MRVSNGIPLGCSLLLLVDTLNSVKTLKASTLGRAVARIPMNSVTVNAVQTLKASTTTKSRHQTTLVPAHCRMALDRTLVSVAFPFVSLGLGLELGFSLEAGLV